MASPYELNSWFANLYYQSVMYDAKPYTDIVALSLEDVDAKTTKTAHILIRVERIQVPLFIPSFKVTHDLEVIVPKFDDFESRCTIILKV